MKTVEDIKEWWRIYKLLNRKRENESEEVRYLREVDEAIKFIKPSNESLRIESENANQ